MKKPAQAVERATLRREKIGYADYLIVDPGLVPALNNFYRNYELSRASLSSGLGWRRSLDTHAGWYLTGGSASAH